MGKKQKGKRGGRGGGGGGAGRGGHSSNNNQSTSEPKTPTNVEVVAAAEATVDTEIVKNVTPIIEEVPVVADNLDTSSGGAVALTSDATATEEESDYVKIDTPRLEQVVINECQDEGTVATAKEEIAEPSVTPSETQESKSRKKNKNKNNKRNDRGKASMTPEPVKVVDRVAPVEVVETIQKEVENEETIIQTPIVEEVIETDVPIVEIKKKVKVAIVDDVKNSGIVSKVEKEMDKIIIKEAKTLNETEHQPPTTEILMEPPNVVNQVESKVKEDPNQGEEEKTPQEIEINPVPIAKDTGKVKTSESKKNNKGKHAKKCPYAHPDRDVTARDRPQTPIVDIKKPSEVSTVIIPSPKDDFEKIPESSTETLESIDLSSAKNTSLVTEDLLMKSMTDSSISDLTVVVEKSLENIGNVPDEEIIKLFDIVSKDFDRSPKIRDPPKAIIDPMEQVGAALSNLIEAVEQTESKIKATVEETKKRQNNKAPKKSKSKTPEKTNRGKNKEAESAKAAVPEGDSTTADPKNVQGSGSAPSAEGGVKSLPKVTKPTQTPVIPPRPVATKNQKKITNSGQSAIESMVTAKRLEEELHDEDEVEEDEEEFIEYQFSPRKVFLCNVCHICQAHLKEAHPCPDCQMIYYCGDKHCREDSASHKDLCLILQQLAKKRGGHIYNNAKILSPSDFRNLRVHTLNLCTSSLKRPLQAFEQEMLLFPKLCLFAECRNWKSADLISCNKCHHVFYCKEHADDSQLAAKHNQWCSTLAMYQKIVTTKRDDPILPDFILSCPIRMPKSLDDLFRVLYRGRIKDHCTTAMISQLATGPLTILNSIQLCKMEIKPSMVIHLIGAELQFEGAHLDKWEAFFLHLMPDVNELRVVFVGPELNVENLPVEILSRIR